MSDDDRDEGNVNYGLILAFDTDEPEFTRGFSLGMLWQKLEHDPRGVEATLTVECAEMVMRIAEAKGLPFTAEPAGDSGEWLWVTIGHPVEEHA